LDLKSYGKQYIKEKYMIKNILKDRMWILGISITFVGMLVTSVLVSDDINKVKLIFGISLIIIGIIMIYQIFKSDIKIILTN